MVIKLETIASVLKGKRFRFTVDQFRHIKKFMVFKKVWNPKNRFTTAKTQNSGDNKATNTPYRISLVIKEAKTN